MPAKPVWLRQMLEQGAEDMMTGTNDGTKHAFFAPFGITLSSEDRTCARRCSLESALSSIFGGTLVLREMQVDGVVYYVNKSGVAFTKERIDELVSAGKLKRK